MVSVRWTKALDGIKDIRKERAQHVRVEKVALDALKSDLEKSKKIRSSLTELRGCIDEKRRTAADIDDKLNRVTHELNSLLELYRKAEAIQSRISQIENQKEIILGNIADLSQNITERTESDEQLRELLASVQRRAQTDEEKREDLEFEKTRLDRLIQNNRDAISAKLTSLGRLQATAEVNRVAYSVFRLCASNIKSRPTRS